MLCLTNTTVCLISSACSPKNYHSPSPEISSYVISALAKMRIGQCSCDTIPPWFWKVCCTWNVRPSTSWTTSFKYPFYSLPSLFSHLLAVTISFSFLSKSNSNMTLLPPSVDFSLVQNSPWTAFQPCTTSKYVFPRRSEISFRAWFGGNSGCLEVICDHSELTLMVRGNRKSSS